MAEDDAERARLGAELAELRAENMELRRERQVLAEQLAALAEVNRELRERVAELERRLSATSRNSHQPPSSEGYAKPPAWSRRGRSGRRPDGQSGSAARRCAGSTTPTEMVTYVPARCAGCGRGLWEAPGGLHRDPAGRRPAGEGAALGGASGRAPGVRLRQVMMAGPDDGVPDGVRAPVQYGPGVATYLVAGHHLPVDRAAAVLGDLLAAPVSPGSISAGWPRPARARAVHRPGGRPARRRRGGALRRDRAAGRRAPGPGATRRPPRG